MKQINWRAFSPTYSKYGEHYSIINKGIIWASLIGLVTGGTILITHFNSVDYQMYFVATVIGYFSLLSLTSVTISSLKDRIKELLKIKEVFNDKKD